MSEQPDRSGHDLYGCLFIAHIPDGEVVGLMCRGAKDNKKGAEKDPDWSPQLWMTEEAAIKNLREAPDDYLAFLRCSVVKIESYEYMVEHIVEISPENPEMFVGARIKTPSGFMEFMFKTKPEARKLWDEGRKVLPSSFQ